MPVFLRKIIFFILIIFLLNNCKTISVKKESALKSKDNISNKYINDKIYNSNLIEKIINVNFENEEINDALSNGNETETGNNSSKKKIKR